MKIPDTITDRRWDPATGDEVTEVVDFEWDGDLILKSEIEGLVVGHNEDGQAQYVIIRIVNGEDHVNDDFFPGYLSAHDYYAWSPAYSRSYRELLYRSEHGFSMLDERSFLPDTLVRVEDQDVEIGDRLLIKRYTAWGSSPSGRGRSGVAFDDIEILERGIDVHAEVERLADLKMRVAAHLAFTLEHLEKLDMSAQRRIEAAVPTIAFAESDLHTDAERIGRRYVFGEGQVNDHYVDIKANELLDANPDIYGGVRFSQAGSVFVTPHILPLGDGGPEDPLMELEVHIHSTTVLNPAVGEQRVDILIDGVAYEACVEPEMSSSSFKNPGHDMVFRGFRRPDQIHDTFRLTDEQADAYFERGREKHQIVMRGLHGALDEGRDVFKDEDEMSALNAQVETVLNDRPVDERLASIQSMNPDMIMGSGAAILVPRSMLDSVQVVFHSIPAE